MPAGRSKISNDIRFWSKTLKTDNCWGWIGTLHGDGRASFWDNNKPGYVTAARFCWELHFGPIPIGMCVLHHCDNPRCVRPDHLFLGTRDENVKDRQVQNRQANGSRNARAKLSETEVIRIRLLYSNGTTAKQIAKHFGLSQNHVYAITGKRYWGNLNEPSGNQHRIGAIS